MSRFTFVAIVALAGTKVIVGLLSSLVALSDSALGAGLPIWGGNFWSTLAIVLAFSITAVVLLAGQSTGLQTRWLGLFMLLAATPFAAALGRMGHPLGGLPDLLSRLHLEAALPATLWLFVSVFPRHSSHKDKPAPKAGVDGWVIGPIAFASLTLDVLTVEGLVATYWPLLMLAMLPAGPLLARRARLASPGERRRVVWFAAAIAAGLSPMAIDIVLRAASSSWRSVVADPGNNRLVTTIAIVCFLSVPATTAYLVVARRVFEFRLVLRKAIGYALAKTTLLLLIVVPTALLARLLFVNRTSTIEELITGPRAIACLVTAAVAAVAFATRVSLVQAIDRRLDRRERDSHDTLFGLVEACRDALSLDDLARMVVGAIEKSLQPTRVAFNVLDESQQQYVDPHASAPALPARSLLVPLLSASNTPLSLAGGVDPSLRGRLDPQSSEWLDTSAWRLLVPMRDDTGALRGMLALGEKRDEHEYTTADRKLLGLVGMACGMALRTRQSAPKTPAPAAVGLPTPSNELAPARECEQCGLVGTPTGIFCSCGGLLHEADVPLVLAGKYKVAMRIGRGGMGVVYRATESRPGSRGGHQGPATLRLGQDGTPPPRGADDGAGEPHVPCRHLRSGDLERQAGARGRIHGQWNPGRSHFEGSRAACRKCAGAERRWPRSRGVARCAAAAPRHQAEQCRLRREWRRQAS